MEDKDGAKLEKITAIMESLEIRDLDNNRRMTKSKERQTNEKNMKDLYVYNTMSGQKELFKPKLPMKVNMYVCGITPYDHSHIGHARVFIAFDVLLRYLHQELGYQVKYVRNFTDIDDNIISRAKTSNEDVLAFSSRFAQEFLNDMGDLQCLRPDQEPKVSEHIADIIEMVKQIENNGCAYTVGGDRDGDGDGDGNKFVYFSVDKFSNYGCLSGQRTEELLEAVREVVVSDSRKRNPADFALWKAAKPGELLSWDSPWGRGRPGWHIECSAMSSKYLTSEFDIHGGGIDLIFPHHENEIAQSWAAHPESDSNTSVGYWMHVGSVKNKDTKMSKSKGNSVLIRDVIVTYHPLALRHFLISTHYRSAVNFSTPQLDNASEAVFYIYQTLRDCEVEVSPFLEVIGLALEGTEEQAIILDDARKCLDQLHTDFHAKMLDDLQTPPVLSAVLPEALKFINKALRNLNKKEQRQDLSLIRSLIEIEEEVKKELRVLGLLSPLTYSEVLQQLRDKALVRAKLSVDEVLQRIQERALARQEALAMEDKLAKKESFLRADSIRKDLAAKGIALMDVGGQTIWKPCVPLKP